MPRRPEPRSGGASWRHTASDVNALSALQKMLQQAMQTLLPENADGLEVRGEHQAQCTALRLRCPILREIVKRRKVQGALLALRLRCPVCCEILGRVCGSASGDARRAGGSRGRCRRAARGHRISGLSASLQSAEAS